MEEKRFRLGNLFNFLTDKQLRQVLGGYGDDNPCYGRVVTNGYIDGCFWDSNACECWVDLVDKDTGCEYCHTKVAYSICREACGVEPCAMIA